MLKHAESYGLGGTHHRDRKSPFACSRPAHSRRARHRYYHQARAAAGSAWRRWACARRFGVLALALSALSLCGAPTATAASAAVASPVAAYPSARAPQLISATMGCGALAPTRAPGHRLTPAAACQAPRLRPSTTGKAWKAGSIATFGDARPLGSPGRAGPDLVGIAVAPDGQGYWAVAASGAVFAYGDAKNYGSVKHYAPARPVAGIVATPTGRGYWVLSGHGGVFSFGNAHYYGSLGKSRLSASVVCMAATPDGHGYWLVTANGHVYTYGDARFYGSLSADYPKIAVRGIAPTPSGRGYWLATTSGHVYSFGTARYHGAMAVSLRTKRGTSRTTSSPITLSAIATAAGGRGYWLLASNGTVHGYGSAPDFAGGHTVTGVTASSLASTSNGRGYVLATTGPRQKTTTHTTQGIIGNADRKGPASELLREAAFTFLGSFLVTCYDLTGATASGDMAGPESIAVDPSVIPLGTQIYVQGVGLRTADDTGGAITGDHVDIWEPTYYACANWGAQVRAVYRVGP